MTKILIPALLAFSAPLIADDKPLTEEQAVAALVKLGVKINGAQINTSTERPVRGVLFGKACQVTDEDLKYLKYIPTLEYAYIVGQKKITGEGLKHLSGLKNLKAIDLDGTPVASQNLVHLKDMKQLWKLGLWRTAIDDEGMIHLKDLHDLEHLYLDGTKVGDKGIEALGPKPRLWDLQYSENQFTEKGRAFMKKNFPPNGVELKPK